MATTTLRAIIDRFQAVCEGADLNLKKTTEEFSFDRQPNARVDNVYRIEDTGLSSSEPVTNSKDVRLDELSIWMARRSTPDNQAVRETLEDDLVTVERKIIADGPANSYHATITGREIAVENNVITARIGFMVDYDYSLT